MTYNLDFPKGERRVSPDRRCQHARASFTCVCGLKVRRDIVKAGDRVQCTNCLAEFEYRISAGDPYGFRVFEIES